MVKKARVRSPAAALLILAMLAMPLASCDVLFNGPFSGTLGQASVIADLSKSILPQEAQAFQLAIVNGFGREFVVLYSSLNFDASRTHLYVLSPKLKLLSPNATDDYTLDFLRDSVPTSGESFKGRFAMRDGRDHIVIGNLDLFPNPDNLTPVQKFPQPYPPNPVLEGFSISFEGVNLVNFDSTGTMLNYAAYAGDWGAGPPAPNTPYSALIASGGPYQYFRGIFADPSDIASDQAYLVFEEQGSWRLLIVRVPKADVANGALATPILEHYPYQSIGSVDTGRLAFTSDGLITFRQNSRSLEVVDPDSGATKASLFMGDRFNELQTGFSFSGDYYCAWDPFQRTITRFESWWKTP